MLWLIARNPWAGVFAVGFCLALYMMENWGLYGEIRNQQDNILDLEKQIVALRSTIGKLALSHVNSRSAMDFVDAHAFVKKKKDGLRAKNAAMSRSCDSL